MTGGAWPRSARIDAPRLVERIAEITGVRLVLEGPCPGGEVGAAYVRWPDGRRSVLNEGHTRTGPLLDLARAAGVPTARQELSAHIDGVRVIVQQRLPGTPPTTIDASLVRQMVDLNDRLAGLLAVPQDGAHAGHPHQRHQRAAGHQRAASRRAAQPAELYLTDDGPGFCLHRPLAAHSRRTARLLAWVHEVGSADTPADGDDLVHLDYQPGNVLVQDGRITGLIDWDGAGRGDRHLDLVVLRFYLLHQAPALTGIVDERLTGVDPARVRAYWAHISLRQVDWSIRHHDAATVDRWLDIAESGMS
ncbi:MAG TPA: phosphotransferase [Actinoplanes sp.]|nr:phosphotransferase [Actinoplanes sp.]